MKTRATFSLLIIMLIAVFLDQAQAGVSISMGEPGFYGRIDIGNIPAPRLIYAEPMIVRPIRTWYPPIYLRVPPGHAKHWYKHCHEYEACGRPVYFVEDAWYREVYIPRYRENHHRGHVPPPPRPHYYEYRQYEHNPPKKVYMRDEYYDDSRRHDDHGNKGHKSHHHK